MNINCTKCLGYNNFPIILRLFGYNLQPFTQIRRRCGSPNFFKYFWKSIEMVQNDIYPHFWCLLDCARKELRVYDQDAIRHPCCNNFSNISKHNNYCTFFDIAISLQYLLRMQYAIKRGRKNYCNIIPIAVYCNPPWFAEPIALKPNLFF